MVTDLLAGYREAVDHALESTKNRRVQTHCKYGHEFAGDNYVVRTRKSTGRDYRWCLVCARRRDRESQRRRRTR